MHVSGNTEKPKFHFSPDAKPFVPKNFNAAKVTANETTVSTLSVEAREFYPRNYIHQPQVSVKIVCFIFLMFFLLIFCILCL